MIEDTEMSDAIVDFQHSLSFQTSPSKMTLKYWETEVSSSSVGI